MFCFLLSHLKFFFFCVQDGVEQAPCEHFRPVATFFFFFFSRRVCSPLRVNRIQVFVHSMFLTVATLLFAFWMSHTSGILNFINIL